MSRGFGGLILIFMTEDTRTIEATATKTLEQFATATHTTGRKARRLLTALFCLALAGLGLAPHHAGALNPPQSEAAGVVWYVGGGPGSIDEFWAATFGGWGLRSTYLTPKIYFYNGYGIGDYDVVGCGNTAARRYNGFYCHPTRTIHLDYSDQTDRIAAGGHYTFGDGEAVGFLAHEWGHHVQNLLRLPVGTIAAEYHADCLAGMYMRYGYASGRLTGGDYWEFHNWLLSTDASSSHGDPTHRSQWYRYGWDRYDVAACNLVYR
jgi:predicted metalloprotease